MDETDFTVVLNSMFLFDKKNHLILNTSKRSSYTCVILLVYSMKQTLERRTQKLSLNNLEFQSFHFSDLRQFSLKQTVQTKDKPSSNGHYRLTVCQSLIAKPTTVNHSFLDAAVNHLQKIFTFSNALPVDEFATVGQIVVKS